MILLITLTQEKELHSTEKRLDNDGNLREGVEVKDYHIVIIHTSSTPSQRFVLAQKRGNSVLSAG